MAVGPSTPARTILRMVVPAPVRRVAARLAAERPTDRPVRVEVVPISSHWADYNRERTHYLIRLSARMDRDSMVETLAHEWAHAVAWDASRVDHGEAWGRAYSRCYRVVVEGWRPRTSRAAARRR